VTGPQGGSRDGDPASSVHEDARRLVEEATLLIDALGGLPPHHAGAECRICPVCRLLATVRELRPEVLEHLSLAAVELLAAVREFAAPTPAGRAPAPEPASERPSERTPAPERAPQRSAAGDPAGVPDPAPDAGPPPARHPADDLPTVVAFRPLAAASERPAVQRIEITD